MHQGLSLVRNVEDFDYFWNLCKRSFCILASSCGQKGFRSLWIVCVKIIRSDCAYFCLMVVPLRFFYTSGSNEKENWAVDINKQRLRCAKHKSIVSNAAESTFDRIASDLLR